MAIVAKAKIPQTMEHQDSTYRKPAKMPIKQETEKTELYICGIKQNAPFESCTLLGMSFHKNVYPSEASLTENIDKKYHSQFLAYAFTEMQVKALKKRAEETIKVISPRINSKFDPKKDTNNDNMEYLPRLEFPTSKYLFIEKAKDYNPISVEFNTIEEKLGEGENLKDNLFKEQAKKRKNER